MRVEKFKMYFNLMERWLTLHEEGRRIPQILEERGLSNIALYGLGKIGKHVVCELEGSSVTIVYAVDRAMAGFYGTVPVKRIDEELPETDAVIVTAVYDYDEIEELLGKKVHCPVISLEEILYEG